MCREAHTRSGINQGDAAFVECTGRFLQVCTAGQIQLAPETSELHGCCAHVTWIYSWIYPCNDRMTHNFCSGQSLPQIQGAPHFCRPPEAWDLPSAVSADEAAANNRASNADPCRLPSVVSRRYRWDWVLIKGKTKKPCLYLVCSAFNTAPDTTLIDAYWPSITVLPPPSSLMIFLMWIHTKRPPHPLTSSCTVIMEAWWQQVR